MPQGEDATIRSINMVPLGQALTDPTLTPPIRALLVYNSNPAVIVPNQQRVLARLQLVKSSSASCFTVGGVCQLRECGSLYFAVYDSFATSTPI
jgi:hypothetical protein